MMHIIGFAIVKNDRDETVTTRSDELSSHVIMMSDFSVKWFLTEKTDDSLLIITDLFIAHWIHGDIVIEYTINFFIDFAKLIVKIVHHIFAAIHVCLGSTF